jgi:acetyl esterase/lipase
MKIRLLGTPILLVLVAGLPGLLSAQEQEKDARAAPQQKAVGAQPDSEPPEDAVNFFPQRMRNFPLYGGGPIPNSKPAPDEEYVADSGFVQKVSRPEIQVYLPARVKATGASIVIFPGGSYAGLTFEFEGTQQAQFFQDHGLAACVVKYRLPSDQTMENKSIGPLQDAQQAIRFVREHAKEWNLDPGRVGAIGFSAGGHLAATLGTHFDKAYVDNPHQINLRPDLLIVVYPVISMDAKVTHLESRKALLGANPTEEQIRFFSNELQVTKDTPPTLILHAADDRLVDVDNSILFFEALRHASVPVEMRLFEKGQHGFFLMPRDRWQGTITEWLTARGWLWQQPK